MREERGKEVQMLWPLLKPLAVGIPAITLYLWFLVRVAHGGKGWPRLTHKRRPRPSSRP